jgi:hypothetical protein
MAVDNLNGLGQMLPEDSGTLNIGRSAADPQTVNKYRRLPLP